MDVNADIGVGIPDALAWISMRTAELLAHQGGWDEVFLVGGPVLVFAFLLSIARKRALALADRDADAGADDDLRSDG